MSQAAAARTKLYESLTLRVPVQDVAVNILELEIKDALEAKTRDQLKNLIRYSYNSHMSSSFNKHPGLSRAFKGASRFMNEIQAVVNLKALPETDPTDSKSLEAWLKEAFNILGLDPASARAAQKTPSASLHQESGYSYPRRPRGPRGEKGGHPDARTGMSASERKEALPGVSVRLYRHAVRSVNHLAQRTSVLAEERLREDSISYAKSRLASAVKAEEFAKDDFSSAFVAYYTARLNERTVFTSGSQARPMDTIAEELLASALKSPNFNAMMVAKVITRQSVLRHLSEAEKGELLGLTYEAMVSAATLLKAKADPGRRSMVVRKGDDSSSWNAASRAFNQARTGWLNLTKSLGMSSMLDVLCPGKVSALIAADVSHWHDFDGGDVHQDEKIAKLLPPPWLVVLGEESCSALMVRNACSAVGVDPSSSGWTEAYRQDEIEAPAPAPELVHGVIVQSPVLAKIMRDTGVFGGY